MRTPLNQDEVMNVAQAMQDHGGMFFQKIGDALSLADVDQQRMIRNAFVIDWAYFRDLVKLYEINNEQTYMINRSKRHKVEHEFSGKMHFYKVFTPEDREHSVSLQVNCDCNYMGVQGIANKKIGSHILAVFRKIVATNSIDCQERKDVVTDN